MSIPTDRRIELAGVLLCATCVAYFYALDQILFSSAHFSPMFRRLLTAHDSQTAWLTLAVCLLAMLWNRAKPSSRLAELVGRNPYSVALLSAVMIAAGAVTVYHNYAFSMDEYAAVFQAKIFASGRVFAILPRNLVDWLIVRGFNGSFLSASPDTGQAIEHYWPGFAILLAPFEFLKAPWACNALLAGAAILIIHRITREITGDVQAAGWAVLFTVASGGFAANAISYYSMQAHLTMNLVFVGLLLRPTPYRAFGAGLAGSLALVLHNPVPHALFAAPWIFAMARDRDQRRYLLPLSLAYLPGLAVGLGWLMVRMEIEGAAQGASAVSALVNGIFAWPDSALLNARAAALVKMWIWAVPCLYLFAIEGRLRYRENRHVRLLAQSAVLTFVGYLFVRFDQGHGWGFRYFHSAWGAIPILAGCALASRPNGQQRLVSFAGAATALNLLIVLLFQMHQIDAEISRHLAQLPPAIKPGGNVYFIHPRGGFYVADMVQIDPLLREPDLLLVSRGEILDTQMIRDYWPGAVKIASARAADQWYLGPQSPPANAVLLPSAADR